MYLDSTSLFQQSIELALSGLEIRIATNVLLGNENVGNAALAGDFLQSILDCGAII